MRRKVLLPVRKALKNGISHKRLAATLALGIIIGLMPFYGFTTLLVGIVAYALRLDFVVMQIIHYAVHPIQLILLIPFFKIGSLLIAKNAIDFTVKEYLTLFRTDFWMALSEFWKLNLYATIIWGIVSIPLFILLYKVFFISIRRFVPVAVQRPFGKV